jgi:6-phosphogluconate dehydrogenase
MIGLGTMGRNLVFNMNDHGYSVAGFDKDVAQVEKLKKEAGSRKVLSVSILIWLLFMGLLIALAYF